MLTFGTAAYLEDQQTFIDYVTSSSFNSDMEFKKMNEKIFNSSQDMWRTLNDRKFLDNVQEFYNARAVLEQQWKEWICFKKPFCVLAHDGLFEFPKAGQSDAFFRHKMVQRFSLSGTWGVEGDSLVMHYHMTTYKMEVDDSEVTYPAHLADSVHWFKEQL